LLRDFANHQLLSSSGILKLAGWGSVGEEQQKGEAMFGAGVCFMAFNVGEKYQSQIYRPLRTFVAGAVTPM
jgi:hypothetical protein